MNDCLKQELLQLMQLDIDTTDRLAQNGELFEGYNPKMQRLHRSNAERLKEIIKEHGWPGISLVGKEAAEAAWIILQHNIGDPKMFRQMLPKLRIAAKKGEIDKIWLAKTIDRIRVYEGKPQLYGTNYDWDENGDLSPYPIQNIKNVDRLRKEIGLPPLSEYTEMMRKKAKVREEKPPTDLKKYRRQMEEWCHMTGWREAL
jgi:hypothetical protein